MKFKGIHHQQPQHLELARQQLLLKSCWWLILVVKSSQFPRQVIKWLPGRLQRQISKAKKALQVSEPIPTASFWVQGSERGCGKALKEEEIFLGKESQTWQDNLCLPISWGIPLLSSLPLLLPGLLTEITIIISHYLFKDQQTSFLGDPSSPGAQGINPGCSEQCPATALQLHRGL